MQGRLTCHELMPTESRKRVFLFFHPDRDALTAKDCLVQVTRLDTSMATNWPCFSRLVELTKRHNRPRRRFTPHRCRRRRRRRRADTYDSAAAACLKLRRRRRDRRGVGVYTPLVYCSKIALLYSLACLRRDKTCTCYCGMARRNDV